MLEKDKNQVVPEHWSFDPRADRRNRRVQRQLRRAGTRAILRVAKAKWDEILALRD